MDHVSLMFAYLAASANWMSRVCPHVGDSHVREGMGFSEMGTCYFKNAGLRNTYTTRLNTERVSHKRSVIGWENFLYHFKSLRDVLQQNLQIFGSNIFLGAMIYK